MSIEIPPFFVCSKHRIVTKLYNFLYYILCFSYAKFGVCGMFYSLCTFDISNTTVPLFLLTVSCAECNIFAGLPIEIPLFQYVLSIVSSQNFTMVCIIYYILDKLILVHVAFLINAVLVTFIILSCSPAVLIDRVPSTIYLYILKYHFLNSFPISYTSNISV